MTTNAQQGENAQTIAQHDVIHKQLQNMVKFTNNRTTWRLESTLNISEIEYTI